MVMPRSLLISAVVLLTLSGSAIPQSDVDLYKKLLPLHEVKKSPQPYDWLATHYEPGQTYEDFIDSRPQRPHPATQFIYISLLGEFNQEQREIIGKVARFLELYYQIPVRFADNVPLSIIPSKARREQPITHEQQILTSYIIEEVLLPRKPKDAFCYIAFSSADLWPGAGWNFVFGQASLDDRVGVWSIFRNGDPRVDAENYHLCLRRTISTGVHEVGHMFGLHHCIYYECTMNGSNHRMESDARPLWLCPVCLRKLNSILNFDPLERYKNLATICNELGLQEEAQFYSRSWKLLESN